MAEASNIDIDIIGKSFGSGDIEAGSSSGHVTHRETMASPSQPLLAYGGHEDWHSDEIDKWVTSLSKKLENVPQYMCSPAHPGRISKIPDNLREADLKAYEPYFLSIGPYHHGKSTVQPMEKSKCLLLRCILENRPELTLDGFLKEVQSIVPAAGNFYSDFEMDNEKFVRMLLLDSLYIVTAFCGMTSSRVNQTDISVGSQLDNGSANHINESMWYGDNSEITQMTPMADELKEEVSGGEGNMTRFYSCLFGHDLFLLENQVPYFALEKMHAFVYGNSETSLLDVIKDKVSHLLSAYTNLNSDIVISPKEKVHHLLHICHMFFRPTLQQESTCCQLRESSQMFRLGSAIQLYEAGVTFEARSSSSEHCLLDITFSRGKLSMPCLHVDDYTDSLLRNLIALEQMKYPTMGLDVCAYAVLLLHLVTTPEDVELLRKKGIIDHHLASDKEMMYFVNRLSVGLSFDYVEDKYSLKPLFHELKRYSQRRVPRWKAWLKHRHFSNPWTAISLMVGFIFLLLSAVQTYYTVYSYYYPLP